MEIKDRIYGSINVTEPVLAELIDSPAIQRLKGIQQFGMPQRFYPYPGFSRYEHSVGVMLVLKKLGANVEEQAAGLIHDVSHTAFSHLVDWVMGDRSKEDHQDKNLQRVVSLSTIPKILQKYDLDSEKITDVKQYSLLEKPAPHLCADRIDYSLREFYTWAAPTIVSQCIDDLVNHNGQIAFKTGDSAEKFAYAYAKCQKEHWGGAECTVRWELLTRALKIGLEKGFVKPDDFYGVDEDLIGKLQGSGNPEISQVLSILENTSLNLNENRTNPQFNLRKKFRYIDPHYSSNGSLHILSETDQNYKNFLEEQRKINERGIKVDILI
ncbi:HD domain-containing protein [Candidatus Pacearchaeota archaeon]|nr:HD domain-containing protein [Candidatus Pacearchaeota archaeon]